MSVIFLARPIKPEIKVYDYFRAIEQSTGYVQVKKNIQCLDSAYGY